MLSGMKRFINPINILIVIALLVLFLNRELLFSERSESREVKQLLDRVDGVVERMSRKAEAGQVDPQPQRDDEAEEEAPPAAITAQAVTAEPEKETPPAERTSMQESPPEGAASQSTEALAGSLSANVMAGQANPPVTDDSIPYTSNRGTDAGRTPTGAETKAIWMQARNAAWRGEPIKAVESYRKLIKMQPENYDAYGELGNVLLQMGDTERAAEAYAHCSLLLNRSGHQQSAWYMLGVVSRLDREKARELYHKLNSRRNAPPHR